jgi:methylmalonyl-CoA mutase cobalamin-binding subunit
VTSTTELPPDPELLSITEVERQTGIRQATLRMWEKRYGFPQPLRDRHGDRVYPACQVERLQAVKRLMNQGIRPGKLLADGAGAETAAIALQPPEAGQLPAEHAKVLCLLRAYRRAELHGYLQYRLLDLGLRRFVIECLAPLCDTVGLAWSRGELPVRSEHLFTQLASAVLHAKQAAVRASGDHRPKVVLATMTGEAHTLGILMVEAVMATLGMECIQLGGDTPYTEVAAAARETAADIVALSFSAYFPAKALVRMVAALRNATPHDTAIWVGGTGTSAVAGFPPGVERLAALEDVEPALQRWRAAAMAPSSGTARVSLMK